MTRRDWILLFPGALAVLLFGWLALVVAITA